MPLRRTVVALALVALALLLGSTRPAAAASAVYYVSPSGSDANAGTSPGSPWRTVARVDRVALSPGDSVLFAGGQTFSDADLAPPASGTAAAPIVFGSYGAGRALLRGPGNPVYLASGVHDVTLTGLDVAGGSGVLVLSSGSTYDIALKSSVVHDTAYAGLASQSSDHDWLVQGNTFRHTGDSAILVGAAHEVIDGNTIADAGWNTALGGAGRHGIYDKGPDTTVSNNDISAVPGGQAISLRFHGARVFGNAIHDTPYAIAFFDYDPAAAPQGASYVYGNRLWNITGWGFYYDGQLDPNGHAPSVDFVVASNTFELSGATEAVNVSPSGSAQVTLANNVFTGSFGSGLRRAATTVEKNNDWFGGSSNVPSGQGDLHVDPKLSAPSSLAPAGDSAVVDRGSTAVAGLSYAPSCDGQPLHYCGAAPELGGVEYVVATPPPPDLTAPSAPSGLAPWSATGDGLTVVWAPATDNVGVAGYDVFVNGAKAATTGSTSATLAGLACGTTYAVGVRAFDAAGNRSATSTLNASTSACPGVDTVAPAVKIASPAAGATVGTAFTVGASATDLGGVAQLRFLLDGAVVCVVPAPSGSCALTAKAGWHTVAVQATDASGNVGSATARVKVARTATARTTARVSVRSSLLHFLRARR
jgi:chitodextrinase